MSDGTITERNLRRVVDAFYARVRDDAELGPIFNGAISDWTRHLEKLSAFWSSVMLTSGRYKGQPMAAHFRHAEAMTPVAFARWLGLWRETTDELLAPDQVAAIQEKAERIAQSLTLGLDFQRNAGLTVAAGLGAVAQAAEQKA